MTLTDFITGFLGLSSDYVGRWVVLYNQPLLAGNTLGCNICRAWTDHRRHDHNIRRYDALFTFEPRGCCGAKTSLLSQRQWRFEIVRMQSRFASSIDMATLGRRALPEGCRIALCGHGRGGKRRRGERLVAAALSKIDAGVTLLVWEVGVALLCFFSGRWDMCIC